MQDNIVVVLANIFEDIKGGVFCKTHNNNILCLCFVLCNSMYGSCWLLRSFMTVDC